ncbi:hypothetical protein BT96DRAFT_963931 [Gymnopus androsaceus JB14]|uniref:ceramidase n=1 Tax=Gymnopus androsaceus JB14 TaxID=1447944 RepID=A0A6A4I889_9AGAR|nr:hypothetical protein BT96DRAFT_963931 [Gymnopus androsaceus JB14]
MSPQTRSKTTATSSSVFRLRSSAEPPVYRVDLSLPPGQRYTQICTDLKPELACLRTLGDEIIYLITPFPKLLNFFAPRILRRLLSREQHKEIIGISKASGIPIHVLVAFNTLLDLFCACTSGGVRFTFRTLDWEMDPLRRLTICVEYVREGRVIARALTYAGHVGVLTGVRTGLSISLELPLPYYWHLFSVIRGRRPSITSRLRDILLSSQLVPSLEDLAATTVMVVEKDFKTLTKRVSDEFLVATNHDVEMEHWSDDNWKEADALREMFVESSGRMQCVMRLWGSRSGEAPRVEDVVQEVEAEPMYSDELTHYSCVMDPSVEGGGILWAKVYE